MTKSTKWAHFVTECAFTTGPLYYVQSKFPGWGATRLSIVSSVYQYNHLCPLSTLSRFHTLSRSDRFAKHYMSPLSSLDSHMTRELVSSLRTIPLPLPLFFLSLSLPGSIHFSPSRPLPVIDYRKTRSRSDNSCKMFIRSSMVLIDLSNSKW